MIFQSSKAQPRESRRQRGDKFMYTCCRLAPRKKRKKNKTKKYLLVLALSRHTSFELRRSPKTLFSFFYLTSCRGVCLASFEFRGRLWFRVRVYGWSAIIYQWLHARRLSSLSSILQDWASKYRCLPVGPLGAAILLLVWVDRAIVKHC